MIGFPWEPTVIEGPSTGGGNTGGPTTPGGEPQGPTKPFAPGDVVLPRSPIGFVDPKEGNGPLQA